MATAEAKEQLKTLSYLLYEQKARQQISTGVQEDIKRLKAETEKLELEERWCFDYKTKTRIIPTPEEEALRISIRIAENPSIEKDVVLALKQKMTTMQMEVLELEEKLKKEKKKHLRDKA